ncbi:MAG: hypothetical protein R3E97_04370 [Candidatus Eisenbacteria bacterium]
MTVRVPGATQLAFLPAPNTALLEHPIEDAHARGTQLDIGFVPESGEIAGTLVVERSGHLEYYAIP